MKRYLVLISLAVAPALFGQLSSNSARVESGTLRGSGSLHAFLGVPYAAPPVGQLRWRPPSPVAPWTGARDATHFSDACVQGSDPHSSEDCLYLNIWTPANSPAERLPVMLWIHGGGFVGGSGGNSHTSGSALARQGAVVVTINYRLGVFGFLAHPELTAESPHHSSGNYGLLDQIEALKWVRRNIEAFGGDSRRVTVFGESAGATSIGYLLVSPLAKGLFQGAILESPSRMLLPDPELHRTVAGLMPLEAVGSSIDPHIAALRAMPAPELMKRVKGVVDGLYAPGGKAKSGLRPEGHAHIPGAVDVPWWAFVDGWVVPDQTQVLYGAGQVATVPVLAGTNSDEGNLFLGRFPVKTEQDYKAYLAENYPPCSEAMLHLYPGGSEAQIKAEVDGIITDGLFLYGAQGILQSEAQQNQNVFLYRFSRLGRNPAHKAEGVVHGAEIPFVFGGANLTAHPEDYDGVDKDISATMMNAWVSFAKTGNPGWPVWKTPEQQYMNFSNSPHVERFKKDQNMKIFKQVFSLHPPATCQSDD